MWRELNLAAALGPGKERQNVADLLTMYTGGICLSFLTQKTLEIAVESVGTDLHDQYLLSFSPSPSGSSGIHRTKVSVRDSTGIAGQEPFWVLHRFTRAKSRCPGPLKIESAQVSRDIHHLADEK